MLFATCYFTIHDISVDIRTLVSTYRLWIMQYPVHYTISVFSFAKLTIDAATVNSVISYENIFSTQKMLPTVALYHCFLYQHDVSYQNVVSYTKMMFPTSKRFFLDQNLVFYLKMMIFHKVVFDFNGLLYNFLKNWSNKGQNESIYAICFAIHRIFHNYFTRYIKVTLQLHLIQCNSLFMEVHMPQTGECDPMITFDIDNSANAAFNECKWIINIIIASHYSDSVILTFVHKA